MNLKRLRERVSVPLILALLASQVAQANAETKASEQKPRSVPAPGGKPSAKAKPKAKKKPIAIPHIKMTDRDRRRLQEVREKAVERSVRVVERVGLVLLVPLGALAGLEAATDGQFFPGMFVPPHHRK